jgi:glycyl-tRNA synthetase beta chain
VCSSDLLQGVMGRHYARLAGEPDGVAHAIEQHWWPKGQGAALPASDDAALVAVADKLDTIVGCFAVGLEPTGSADPFGLRRAAIGVWQIMLDRGWRDAGKYLRAAIAALAEQGVTLKDTAPVEEFLRVRLRGILVEQGTPTQDADAALAQGWTDPVDARERASACGRIPKQAREVFKRIANILDDARRAQEMFDEHVDGSLFQQVENDLWNAFSSAQGKQPDNYDELINVLVTIHPHVEAFFGKGGVLVMDPKPELRRNRLSLLNAIHNRFARIADFRKLGASA